MLTDPGSVQRESQTFQRNKNRTESCDVFENFQIRFILFCFSLITGPNEVAPWEYFYKCESFCPRGDLHAGIYPYRTKVDLPPRTKSIPPWDLKQTPPRDTVNERPVRILLECILVGNVFTDLIWIVVSFIRLI